MVDYNKLALQNHKQLQGKLEMALKDIPDSRKKPSIYYTPGIGAVSSYLAKHPQETRNYTWTNNLVAVVSDGSAVLGLGNIGPEGALPVMEGKAMLFKHFGGINPEDIAAPVCFEVEERLIKALSTNQSCGKSHQVWFRRR